MNAWPASLTRSVTDWATNTAGALSFCCERNALRIAISILFSFQLTTWLLRRINRTLIFSSDWATLRAVSITRLRATSCALFSINTRSMPRCKSVSDSLESSAWPSAFPWNRSPTVRATLATKSLFSLVKTSFSPLDIIKLAKALPTVLAMSPSAISRSPSFERSRRSASVEPSPLRDSSHLKRDGASCADAMRLIASSSSNVILLIAMSGCCLVWGAA